MDNKIQDMVKKYWHLNDINKHLLGMWAWIDINSTTTSCLKTLETNFINKEYISVDLPVNLKIFVARQLRPINCSKKSVGNKIDPRLHFILCEN
jgi:hypothetical protein